MAYRKQVVSLIIVVLLFSAFAVVNVCGCGSGEKKGATETEKSAKSGAKEEPTTQTGQSQNCVFSTTVSEDTKTGTFTVKTTSQELSYNVEGGDDASVTITVHLHPDGKMRAGANAFEAGLHKKTIYLEPGTYYMNIMPSKCSVKVEVFD